MVDKNNLPKHIAIIMDGNGRWAKERGLPRTAGHREGTKSVKEIVRACGEFGIEVLTLFAFSSENWLRPKREINALMYYFNDALERQVEELAKNNVRFQSIGKREHFSQPLQKRIIKAEKRTEHNTGMRFILALDYGARQEIADAAMRFCEAVLRQETTPQELIDEDALRKYLYTKDIPDPDFLIRTSGEMRLSNFLLWQLSYAELYFVKKYWPDFKKKDLEEAIKEFQSRQRRFGKT